MPEYVRQTGQEEQRANAREKVAQAARRGEDPRVYFNEDSLTWAFEHRGAELEQLVQVADQARAAQEEQQASTERRLQLKRETDRVLDERDARAREERRRDAEGEARRRLGWEDE